MKCDWEVIVMEKNKNKTTNKNMQKNMNRTEFAQEYSLTRERQIKTTRRRIQTNVIDRMKAGGLFDKKRPLFFI